MNIESHSTFPDLVKSVLIFGSVSRGDADSNSDLDIAVFVEAQRIDELVEIKRSLIKQRFEKNPNFSIYSTVTANKMAESGSLFLWHLKYEGKTLFSKDSWEKKLLVELAPYSREKAIQDIKTFRIAIDDVQKSLNSGSELLYEASTLFSILRGVGMIFCMRSGVPTFRRLEPIERLRKFVGPLFGMSSHHIEQLKVARHIYGRSILHPFELERSECEWMAENVARIADEVGSYVIA